MTSRSHVRVALIPAVVLGLGVVAAAPPALAQNTGGSSTDAAPAAGTDGGRTGTLSTSVTGGGTTGSGGTPTGTGTGTGTGAAGTGTGTDTGARAAATSGTGSLDALAGQALGAAGLGGPTIDGGSQVLRTIGSVELADAGLAAGQVLGSAAGPLGSAGGSAAMSLASSGLVPGSTYVNATGSLGSGTIGLGSVSIPEYAIPLLGINFVGGYFTALGERQEAGKLTDDDVRLWTGVVARAAVLGGTVQDAADASGTELPPLLTGSIASVRKTAARNALGDIEMGAHRKEGRAGDGKAAADGKVETNAKAAAAPVASPPAARPAAQPVQAGAAGGHAAASAPAPAAAPGATGSRYAAASEPTPAVSASGLASTGSPVAWTAAGAGLALLLGTALLAVRRRA